MIEADLSNNQKNGKILINMDNRILAEYYWSLDLDDLEDEIGRQHPKHKQINKYTESRGVWEELVSSAVGRIKKDVKVKPEHKEQLIDKIFSFVQNNKEELIHWICIEKNYCKSKKKLDNEGWQVVLSLSDAFMGMTLQMPIPVTLLSVYLIKKGILDRICSCK